MGTVNNPHNYSTTSGTTPTAQITDDVDYPHTGLIKSLSQGIRGNYAIKGSATDFDITFADGGSFTTIAVTTGKAYRDGKLVTITALSATDMNTTYNSGTGAVDITPVTDDFYLMLVAKSDNTMVLRGSNAVTNRIPDYEEGDIPIAIIKVVGGSADDSATTSDRLVQFLTTSKVSNDLSIGYDDSGYTEAGNIVGASTGTTVTSIGTLTLDSDDTKITASANGKPTLTLENTASVASAASEPQIIFDRTGASDSGTSGDLGQIIFRGKESGGATQVYVALHAEALDETHPQEDGRIRLTVARNGSDGLTAGTSEYLRISGTEGVIFNHEKIDINFAIMGDTNDNVFYVDGNQEKIGIGHAVTTANDATLDIVTGGTFRNTRLLTVSVSASTTLTEAAHAGRYNICAGNITLPATSTAGEHYAILNTTGGDITIGRNGNNINGAGSDVTLGTYKAATCIAIGSNNWMVIGV